MQTVHHIRLLLSSFLAVIGCVMMYCGVAQGELNTILQKAVRVCLECIGIG